MERAALLLGLVRRPLRWFMPILPSVPVVGGLYLLEFPVFVELTSPKVTANCIRPQMERLSSFSAALTELLPSSRPSLPPTLENA